LIFSQDKTEQNEGNKSAWFDEKCQMPHAVR